MGLGSSLRYAEGHIDGRNFNWSAVVASRCHELPMHWLLIGYSQLSGLLVRNEEPYLIVILQ
jgi:hypothetical protein